MLVWLWFLIVGIFALIIIFALYVFYQELRKKRLLKKYKEEKDLSYYGEQKRKSGFFGAGFSGIRAERISTITGSTKSNAEPRTTDINLQRSRESETGQLLQTTTTEPVREDSKRPRRIFKRGRLSKY